MNSNAAKGTATIAQEANVGADEGDDDDYFDDDDGDRSWKQLLLAERAWAARCGSAPRRFAATRRNADARWAARHSNARVADGADVGSAVGRKEHNAAWPGGLQAFQTADATCPKRLEAQPWTRSARSPMLVQSVRVCFDTARSTAGRRPPSAAASPPLGRRPCRFPCASAMRARVSL